MLVLTWLVFAGLATTAGFAAVGLVGDGLDVAAAPSAAPTGSAASALPTASSASGTEAPTPGTTRSATATRSSSAARPGSATASAARPVDRTATRSIRGNYVSATCRGSTVTLSASPAQGWVLDDYRPGPGREARARFRSDAGEVEFKVSCSGGRPVFDVKDEPDDSDDD
jgi:hypothetical protein